MLITSVSFECVSKTFEPVSNMKKDKKKQQATIYLLLYSAYD